MDLDTIRAALGELQEDPDRSGAWQTLDAALGEVDSANGAPLEVQRLLHAAASEHGTRGEWEAHSRLLEIEAGIVPDARARADLMLEVGRVYQDELLNETAAEKTYASILEAQPGDPTATERLSETSAKRDRWKERLAEYLGEAEGATDDVYKSSMLMRAAEMEMRFGDGDGGDVAERLQEAVELDPTNAQAGKMLECFYRRHASWEEAAALMGHLAESVDDATGKASLLVRRARVLALKLGDPTRAAAIYESVLEQDPIHREARGFLDNHYENTESWSDLVALYERDLGGDINNPERLGDMMQIAMLHWKKREDGEAAAEWFDRILGFEPGHPLGVMFFREHCEKTGDDARLLEILTAAQTATPDGDDKTALAREIAKLAEGQSDGEQAIEQYKAVLRGDPHNVEARQALKRLYQESGAHNALVELLRLELERLPRDAADERLALLWEVAGVYRSGIQSDSALVKALNQVLQLDPESQDACQELIGLYQTLGRWRELLTTQEKLAELSDDPDIKKELYREVARAWFERNNVQNASKAFQALREVDPTDAEAIERLGDLYRKRRAWPALYELCESTLESTDGEARLELLREMAQLAGDRLQQPEAAIRIYRELLAAAPEDRSSLEPLERLAEKSKNWAVLAETLELDIDSADDENTKIHALQKLAGIYETLEDTNRAASAWRRILEIQPGHGRALRVLRDGYLASGEYDGLEELYLSQDDAAGLADVLNGAAERAKETDVKLELSYRAAALYEDPLDAPERAQRCYERVLATDDCQTKAATALIGFYEEGEKWQKLPPLYELLLAAADDPEEQLDWLGRLIELNRERLGDLPAAIGYARSAYALSPSDQTLLTLEEQAGVAGTWDGVAEALAARLEKVDELEPNERVSLRAKLAEIYAARLDRLDDAIATYRALLTEAPEEREAADAFEQLARESRRAEDLRWLTELRVEKSGSEGERVDRLCEAAALELTEFEDAGRAIDLYRRALEVDAEDLRALSALPPLLIAAGEIPGAVAIMERHREHLTGGERATVELALAGLYLDPLEQPEDALLAISAALEAGADDALSRVSELLSRLVAHESVKTDAALLLADLCASGDDPEGEVKALQVLLDAAEDADERGDLYSRMIDIHQEKLGAFEPAFELSLSAARESLSSASLWERADQLAVPAGKVAELVAALGELLQGDLEKDDERELAERAARLQEDRLGDSVGAVPYLERVLKLDPSSEAAFTRLKDILTGAERWNDLQGLYDRVCDAAEDPDRKMELLSEAALICEEIIEKPEQATRYYERIHEIDPHHDGALSALERLYERNGRHSDLAGLLSERIEDALGDERVTLERRLAELLISRLDQPEAGLSRLEVVLAEDAADISARDLAEQVLGVASLRPRAAKLLESVYSNLGQSEDLARILAVRLETLKAPDVPDSDDDDESADAAEALASRSDLLRRLAELREDVLQDEAGAFDAWAQLVPSEPLDDHARGRLVDLARRLARHEELATILLQTAEASDETSLRGELLMQAARICEDFLHGADRAEAIYRDVLNVDPEDVMLALPAARELERLADAGGRLADVAEALERQAAFEQESDRRREIFRRLGELYGASLDQPERAVAAWRMLLEDDPTDTAALAALDVLCERLESWAELATIIEQRLEATNEAGERRDLRVRLAALQAERLERLDDAVDAWRAVLDENPGDERALEALGELFVAQERWEELEDALQQRLEIVNSDERVDLLVSLADLRRTKLELRGSALDAYREVLALQPQHEATRAAVWTLLDSDDSVSRADAAALLRQLYEAEANFDKLLDVLERDAAAAEDPTSKLEGLEAALRVAEGPLDDPARAWSFAERGLHVAAPEPEATVWVQHVERIAGAAGQRAAQAALLRKVAPELVDSDLQLQVALTIACLARDTENDAETATTYFERALEVEPDNGQALQALESLYASADAFEKLHDILERRASLSEDDGDRRELDLRRAKLLADELNNPEQATEVYEGLLDGGPEPRVTDALELLYSAQERWDALMELFQRQIDTGVGEASSLHVRIAEVAIQHQDDAFRAVDELQTALDVDLECSAAVTALQKLIADVEDPELRGRAASLLEPVHLAHEAYDDLRDVLEVRLAASSDDALARRELGARLAELHETHRQDIPAALEAMAAIVQDEPTDEESRGSLERLAKLAGLDKRLSEIYCALVENLEIQDDATSALCVRTAELLVELGQRVEAVALYRRALEFSPESEPLFEAIDALLVQLDCAEERVALYEASLDHCFEPETRVARLHTLAELREAAGDLDSAVGQHRAILDIEESDARSLDALTGLLGRLEQWDELVEHLQHRAEISEAEGDAAGHRLALAAVLNERLDDAERSIDQLEEAIRLVPAHPGALEALEGWLSNDEQKSRVIDILQPVYEEIDDWQKVLRLNEERLALVDSDIDRVGLLRDSARLLEDRGESVSKARAAYGAALELDPEDAELRENYERLAEVDKAWDEWVQTYERISASERGESSIVDLMTVAARVHDENRDDPRSALGAYMKIWEADQSDSELGEKIEDLSTMLGDWGKMVRLLELREDQVIEDAERADLARRRGRMLRDMLDDKPRATTAFERAMAVDPEHAETLDSLIALYKQADDAAERLAELYERRIEVALNNTETPETELGYELLLALADTVETDLEDRGRAIETLNQASGLKPGEASVLERLGALYEAEEQWSEFLDNHETRALAAASADARVALRKRMASVMSEQLQRFEDAVEVYRLVLDEVPEDAAAVAALRELAEEHEDLRGVAAPILTKALRVAGDQEALAGALELQLSVQTDASDRAETLQSLSEVLEQTGNDEASLEALLRALGERPDLAEIHAGVERLAAACEGWESYASVLAARADGTFDAELACDLFSRLGRVAVTYLSDNERAAEAYKKAVEQVGEQPALLEALDGVYVALEDYENVADILERRAQVTDSEELQAEMYCRLAGLQVHQFGDKERGLSSLERALDLVPNLDAAVVELEKLAADSELFEAASDRLETIYRASGRAADLASLYQKRVGLAPSPEDRRELRSKFATVLEAECGDVNAAQKLLELGLAEDTDPVSLAEAVERLAQTSGEWDRAAAALVNAAKERDDLLPDVAVSLCLTAASWLSEYAHDARAAESALEVALAVEPESIAVLDELARVQRGAGRQHILVATLRKRANLASDDEREDYYRDARDLCRSLDDAALAEEVVREALDRRPNSQWALAQLVELRGAAGDRAEVLELTLRQADLEGEGGARRDLWRSAAVLAEELSEAPRAIDLHDKLFSEDPTDTEAATALERLLSDGERWEKIVDVLQRRIAASDDIDARGEVRLRLANIATDKLNQPALAIELYETLLDEAPERAEPWAELPALYEASERLSDLAAQLDRELNAVVADSRDGDEAALVNRLAALCEERLEAPSRAIDVYAAAVGRHPERVEWLTALVRLYKAADDTAAAADRIERLLELSDEETVLGYALDLAELSLVLDDDARAIAALQKALSVGERNEDVRSKLAGLYEKTEAWEALIALWVGDSEHAESVDDKVALLRRASALRADRLGDAAGSVALLERARDASPDDRELLLEVCDAYSNAGRADDAIQALEQIVQSYGGRRSKELADIHRRIANACLARGENERALTELDLAFRIQPGNLQVLNQLGRLSLENDDFKKAQQMFRALLLQKLGDDAPITKAEVFMFLGQVHSALGERAKAVQNLESAIRTNPELAPAKELLEQIKGDA